MQKTIAIDFDGVIHSYVSGWQGITNIPDDPVPGQIGALEALISKGYDVVIFSQRCASEEGINAVKKWLERHRMGIRRIKQLRFSYEKPKAWLLVDDRAWCFDGELPTAEEIEAFRPWNKREQRC